jgi:chromatin remodeling complex protein RSC6
MASLDSIQVSLLALEKSIKALQRETHKIRQRLEDPTGEKAKARSENNSFKRPQQVSDQLRSFLKLSADETVSRSEVTKRIFAYAKENKLNNGKVINLDDSLRSLLNPVDGQDVTVTNLQKYINHHYVKAPPPPPVAHAATAASTQAPKRPKVATTKA